MSGHVSTEPRHAKGEAFRQAAASDLSFPSPNAPERLSPAPCNWASVVNAVLTALHAPVPPLANANCITLYSHRLA